MSAMKYSQPQKLIEKSDTCFCDPKYIYETSNKRDYKGLDGEPACDARPPTSKFYSDTNTGETGYKEEFGWKSIIREKNNDWPEPSAGQRKNNPHPKETFMVWKFQNTDPNTEKHTKDELLHEICQDKIRSTYQVDYKGLQQGQKKSARDSAKYLSEVKHEPPKTLNTTIRVDYQSPNFRDDLNGHTTRYGCNSNKRAPAKGAVPTCVRGVGTLYDTSYSKEYIKKESKVKNSHYAHKDISEYLQNMSVNEKQVIANMLDSVKGNKTGDEVQNRISGWDGPSWK